LYGARVPVQVLPDDLEAGDIIDGFLEGFRSVTREQVIAFLEEAKDWPISGPFRTFSWPVEATGTGAVKFIS
jgi:hypothetical protein